MRFMSLLVDGTEHRRCRRWLLPLGCIHGCAAMRNKHETSDSFIRKQINHWNLLKENLKGGNLRSGASAGVEATGPPSEVSMAARRRRPSWPCSSCSGSSPWLRRLRALPFFGAARVSRDSVFRLGGNLGEWQPPQVALKRRAAHRMMKPAG